MGIRLTHTTHWENPPDVPEESKIHANPHCYARESPIALCREDFYGSTEREDGGAQVAFLYIFVSFFSLR